MNTKLKKEIYISVKLRFPHFNTVLLIFIFTFVSFLLQSVEELPAAAQAVTGFWATWKLIVQW